MYFLKFVVLETGFPRRIKLYEPTYNVNQQQIGPAKAFFTYLNW